MAKKRRAHDDQAWREAKKICRLNARQLEMARRLGMNPKKLPRLRPSPQQRWKLPVGKFVEELYSKRFGFDPLERQPLVADRGSRKSVLSPADALAPESVSDAESQTSDLACYCMNLADDLQKWLAHGSVDPEVLHQVREELREIVAALDTGAPISPIPEIPLPPRPARLDVSRRGGQKRPFEDEIAFDDEVPF